MSHTKEQLAAILRVNQAGEYGAKRIYEGQLAYLENKQAKQVVQHMYEQELEHLHYFNNQVVNRRVRPTAMQPLWHIAAFSLGAISALLGTKMAMACTVAVEEVIDAHYQDQIKNLQNNEKEQALTSSIKRFQTDENEHREKGLEYGTDLGCEIFKGIVKLATKAAISVSKKI
jgi:ubiquinone biosynthesis monooxygenase Coq7